MIGKTPANDRQPIGTGELRVSHGNRMTNPDPFAAAACRLVTSDPAWWDVDAPRPCRALASILCATCPARAACTVAAARLGEGASGTWAGVWLPWVYRLTTDEALAEWLTITGTTQDAHFELSGALATGD